MSFEPNWVSIPGNTIKNILSEREINKNSFAEMLGWNIERVNKLIAGELNIDENLAIELKQTLGASTNFWLSRQNNYNLRKKKIELKRVNWINNLPVKEMFKNDWINKTTNIFEECLSFFNVPDIETWECQYADILNNTSFRISPSYDSEKHSIAVWIRRAEIMTNDIKHNIWNKDLFEKKLFTEIKPLTRLKNPAIFIPKLIKICAECGVLLALVPTIGKCYASGATKLLNKHKALMILSFRYLSDDHFWFTFFHEAGHLILHEGHSTRIDCSNIQQTEETDEEKEANIFSSECLIPYQLKEELFQLKRNKRAIIEFASKANVSPGIVVGQLQYHRLIKFEYLNDFKRRFSWEDINTGIRNSLDNLKFHDLTLNEI